MKLIASTLRSLGLAVLTVLIVIGSFASFAPSAMADTYTVKLGADNGMLAFEPRELTVKPGDTIKWVNNKMAPHNFMFDDNALGISHNQLMFSPGETDTTTIPADAVDAAYDFYCQPHRGAGMVGKLIVRS